MYRVKMRWSGFTGAPGYYIFHFANIDAGEGGGGFIDAAGAQQAVDKVAAFANLLKGYIPLVAALNVEGDVEIIDSTDGSLINVISVTSPVTYQGGGTGNFSSPAGAVINWRTATIRRGRRMRGKTFLVPLVATSFSTGGGVSSSAVTAIAAAGNTMAAAGTEVQLGVFGRPSGPAATDGVFGFVASASVPNSPAILTSRRD